MGNNGDSEQTWGLLIDAAGELFAERGFNGVTARQIVAKAGVSRGRATQAAARLELVV